jgi:hypothetical protein
MVIMFPRPPKASLQHRANLSDDCKVDFLLHGGINIQIHFVFLEGRKIFKRYDSYVISSALVPTIQIDSFGGKNCEILAGRQRGTLNSFNPHLSTIHSSAFLIQA